MKRFRDERVATLRAEGYAVDFTLEKGASPTLTLARGDGDMDVEADEVVDIGSWTSDVIADYVRSKVATSPRDEL